MASGEKVEMGKSINKKLFHNVHILIIEQPDLMETSFPVYFYLFIYFFSAGQLLIAINRIKNKYFVDIICMYTVYIYYVCIKTQTYSTHFENIYMYKCIFI